MKDFYKTIEEELQMIVPIVQRVHGEEHPEFHEVKKLYDTFHENIDNEDFDFEGLFNELKKITDHYTIPYDVCETYEKVYVSLKELDNKHHV